MATAKTPKQKAREQLKALLQNQLDAARKEIHLNKYEFKKLTEKQTILKRKLAEVQKLIRDLEVL